MDCEAMKKLIDELYQEAIEEIKGGSLFGTPIDIESPRMVAVAFYHLAKQKEQRLRMEESDKRMQVLFAKKGLL